MNANLLTIDLMFAANACASPVSSKPAADKNTRQFPPIPADKSPSANTSQTVTTDNIPANTQSSPIIEPPQRFCRLTGEETAAEQLKKRHTATHSKQQSRTSAAAPQPGIVQLWLAQYSQMVEHGKKAVARKVQPKAGYELAQMLAGLRNRKSPPGLGQTTKPPLLRFTPAAKHSWRAGQPAAETTQTALKGVLPDISTGLLTANTQPGKGKNAGKIQISNETLVAKGLTNRESGKALTPEVLTGDSKTAIASEKPAGAGKPAVSGDQKTPVSNDSFPTVQDKSSNSRQEVPAGPEKSPLIAEKPTNDKANAAQQGRVSILQNGTKSGPGQTSSELSGSNGKQSQHAANNPSDHPTLQELNQPQVRISTNQTKAPDNPTSNNSSNSHFEQIFSPGDAQTLVTQQTSASSQAANTANNASLSDAYASINEQILESIHSSLRQGDLQITIRLNPPGLGKVLIRFQEQQDQITGLLEVSRTQTRVEIQQALPQIIRNLQNSGIQIKRLEVMLTDQSEQQAYKDQSLQDGSFQQHGFTEGGNPDNESANEWLINDNSFQDNPEPQLQISDNSINMLI